MLIVIFFLLFLSYCQFVLEFEMDTLHFFTKSFRCEWYFRWRFSRWKQLPSVITVILSKRGLLCTWLFWVIVGIFLKWNSNVLFFFSSNCGRKAVMLIFLLWYYRFRIQSTSFLSNGLNSFLVRAIRKSSKLSQILWEIVLQKSMFSDHFLIGNLIRGWLENSLWQLIN